MNFDPKNIPANVSGKMKDQIPDLPIITSGGSARKLPISTAGTSWNAVAKTGTRERWNDWGIGLLLQGDLKGAEYAFRKVTKQNPVTPMDG